jgi:hypothetical protein
VTIHAHAFTRQAISKMEAAGSTVQLISWPDGAPLDFAPAASAPTATAGKVPPTTEAEAETEAEAGAGAEA